MRSNSPLRSFLVWQQGKNEQITLMCRHRTQALLDGAELLNAPVTKIRALQLHDF